MPRLAMLCRTGLVLALVGAGCGGGQRDSSVDGKIKVTATTGMVAELATHVGGERVKVTYLMGPGVDPHLYKASEGDIERLAGADVILYNGLNLEGKMTGIFTRMARSGRRAHAVSATVEEDRLRAPPEFRGHHDPHIWFDVSLWAETIPAVVEAFADAMPSARADFEANAARYRDELLELHEYCKARIATIPKSRRVLITAHDAFGYFGRAYDIDVVGLQGISTSTEYGLGDVRRVVDIIARRRVRAVFIESSVPRRSIEAVVAGCKAAGRDVSIGGELFSDAMGNRATPEGTYVGMVRYNVETIVEALR